MNLSELRDWLAMERANTRMTIKKIAFEDCKPWAKSELEISRPDRKFFSIQQKSGLFINQPEIGILAFLLLRTSSTTRILIQAKPEPGNTLITQIAPSVQATHSNYSRAHGGSETLYLKELQSLISSKENVLNDTLQSEHGHRFWRKVNRNISVLTQELPLVHDHFRAVEVRTLLSILHDDFAVNTDARSVLATSPWESLTDPGFEPFSRDTSEWAMSLKKSYNQTSQFASASQLLKESRRALSKPEPPNRVLSVSQHQDKTQSIRDEFNENNSVEFFGITSESREVPSWNQPLYLQKKTDSQVLLCRTSANGLEFLLKTRTEPGLKNKVEFGNTLCETDQALGSEGKTSGIVQEIQKIVESTAPIVRCQQSDEGGRFYRNICEYSLVYLEQESQFKFHDSDLALDGYFWANLRTVQDLCRGDGFTTNELRSTVSLLLHWL